LGEVVEEVQAVAVVEGGPHPLVGLDRVDDLDHQVT
jgi:hypothetical protein